MPAPTWTPPPDPTPGHLVAARPARYTPPASRTPRRRRRAPRPGHPHPGGQALARRLPGHRRPSRQLTRPERVLSPETAPVRPVAAVPEWAPRFLILRTWSVSAGTVTGDLQGHSVHAWEVLRVPGPGGCRSAPGSRCSWSAVSPCMNAPHLPEPLVRKRLDEMLLVAAAAVEAWARARSGSRLTGGGPAMEVVMAGQRCSDRAGIGPSGYNGQAAPLFGSVSTGRRRSRCWRRAGPRGFRSRRTCRGSGGSGRRGRGRRR